MKTQKHNGKDKEAKDSSQRRWKLRRHPEDEKGPVCKDHEGESLTMIAQGSERGTNFRGRREVNLMGSNVNRELETEDYAE